MMGRLVSPRVVNIADLRRLAKRRLPRVVFDYIDGGADDEITLRENCRAFDDVTFRPRCAVATPSVRSADDGARHHARAAVPARARRQQPHVLSARRSGRGARGGRRRHRLHPVDAVGHAARGRQGRDDAARSGISSISSAAATSREAAIARARAAGYSALVVTIDTPGRRHARARLPQRRRRSC